MGGTLIFEVSVSDGVNTSVDTVRVVINEAPEDFAPEGTDANGQDMSLAARELSVDEDPFQELNEALEDVEVDLEEGPLREVVGQVFQLADATPGLDVQADLLDHLASVADDQEFAQVFETNDLDAVGSLLPSDADQDSSARDFSEDLAREGIAEEETEKEAKPEGAIAKFFGLVRGLAGTTEKSEPASSDKKTKDANRRN